MTHFLFSLYMMVLGVEASNHQHLNIELKDENTIALWGGTNFVNMKSYAFLEALIVSHSENSPSFRNISWQADTVFKQQRPRNFGTHQSFVKRVGVNSLILSFGQSEILDTSKTVGEFYIAYDKFIVDLKEEVDQIILINLFEFPIIKNKNLPALSQHNDRVRKFNGKIKDVALAHKLELIDISSLKVSHLTDSLDGFLLNEQGLKKLSHKIASQLIKVSDFSVSEKLRKKIVYKNELWDRHWRPDNWGFVYGNRTHVPSSWDHMNRKERWMPKEIQEIEPEVEALDHQIQNFSK